MVAAVHTPTAPTHTTAPSANAEKAIAVTEKSAEVRLTY